MGSFPCGLRDGCWKHKRWKWRIFLNHCTVYNLSEEVGFSLQSPHMHYFYEKEVIAASQRLALPTPGRFPCKTTSWQTKPICTGLADSLWRQPCVPSRGAICPKKPGEWKKYAVLRCEGGFFKKNQGNLAHTPPTITATSLRDGHDKQKSHFKDLKQDISRMF